MLMWEEFLPVMTIKGHIEIIIYTLGALNEGLSLHEFPWFSIQYWYFPELAERNKKILQYACNDIVSDNQYYVVSDPMRPNPQFPEEIFDRTVQLCQEMDLNCAYLEDLEGKLNSLIQDFKAIQDFCGLIESWMVNPDR